MDFLSWRENDRRIDISDYTFYFHIESISYYRVHNTDLFQFMKPYKLNVQL